MSDHNLITDRELHELLKRRLLEQGPDDAFTQKLIDMELMTAFATEPLIAPGLEKEKELLRKLAKNTGTWPGFKWLFTGLSVAVLTTSAFLLNRPGSVETVKATNTFPADPAPGFTASQQRPAPEPLQAVAPGFLKRPAAPDTVIHTPPGRLQAAAAVISDSTANAAETAPLPEPQQTLFYPGRAPSGTYSAFKKQSSDSSLIRIDTLLYGIRRLEVTGMFCDVSISTGKERYISVKGEMTFGSKGAMLRKPDYQLHYEQKDSVLRIRVENTKKAPLMMCGEIEYGGMLSLVVPEQTVVFVKNAGGNVMASGLRSRSCHLESNYGNVAAENIQADLNLRSTSGNVAFKDIQGQVTSRVSYGNIHGSGIRGKVEISSSSGHIQLADVSGDVEVASSYGNTDVKRITGNVRLRTSSGHIKAEAVEGSNISVGCSYGSVSLTGITASLSVRVSSGDLTLQNIHGNVSLSSSYGRQQLSNVSGDVAITSSSGNIDIDHLHGALRVNSVYGHVHADDCQGMMDIKTQSGNIKGKNLEVIKSLSLRASYGDIEMNLKNGTSDLSFNLQSQSGHIKLNREGLKLESSDGKLNVEKGGILVRSVTSSGNQYFD